MRRKKAQYFSHQRFVRPTSWRQPSVLLASLGINLLALALPTLILQVYDRIIPNQAYDTFIFLIGGMLAVVVLDAGLKIFRSMILSWDSARFDHRESLKAMNRILDSETLAFEEKSSGYYLDKMQALERVQEFYSGQSMLLLMDSPFVLIYLALIWVIAGPLILIPLSLLALFVVASIWTGRHLQQALETRQTIEDRRQNFIIETLRGIHTVKSMAMEPFMMRRYERLQSQSAASVYELSRINSIVQGVGATFSQLAVVSFVGIGSLSVIDGHLTVGALAAGTMLSSRVLQPGLKAMGVWTQFQSVRLALRKIEDLFSLKQEQHGDFRVEGDLDGGLELADVHFRYPEQAEPVLRGVSLKVRPGEAIGITGNNGAGKSTLMGLLSGFLQPDSGEVLLDGRNLRDYQLEVLRAHIGIVPQKGTLFEGTILENMTLYREGEAMEQAIELSSWLGLDEIVSRLPDGLDTHVGGAAVDTLSEGVRQKIVMIRALVGLPKVMLFDDANANFDLRNDNKFLHLLQRLKGDRTLVIVSHRPSFLRLCDRRFVLTEGRLQEDSDTGPEMHKDPSPALRQQAASNAG
jgi:ATP-binding cassette subfamily C protein LapB